VWVFDGKWFYREENLGVDPTSMLFKGSVLDEMYLGTSFGEFVR